MDRSNPTHHVILALALTAVLFIVAGDQWSRGITALRPVTVAARKP